MISLNRNTSMLTMVASAEQLDAAEMCLQWMIRNTPGPDEFAVALDEIRVFRQSLDE